MTEAGSSVWKIVGSLIESTPMAKMTPQSDRATTINVSEWKIA
jgi:hypothetical protein